MFLQTIAQSCRYSLLERDGENIMTTMIMTVIVTMMIVVVMIKNVFLTTVPDSL